MRPKKAKELIKPVAENLGKSPKLVEDVVNFYWREVWNSLTQVEDIKVHVTNLGDFNIKHWLLDKELEALNNMKNKNRFSGAQRYKVIENTQAKIDLIENLKIKFEDENRRKQFIGEHKKNLKDVEKIQFKRTLET